VGGKLLRHEDYIFVKSRIEGKIYREHTCRRNENAVTGED
jgi:hypothetical protein